MESCDQCPGPVFPARDACRGRRLNGSASSFDAPSQVSARRSSDERATERTTMTALEPTTTRTISVLLGQPGFVHALRYTAITARSPSPRRCSSTGTTAPTRSCRPARTTTAATSRRPIPPRALAARRLHVVAVRGLGPERRGAHPDLRGGERRVHPGAPAAGRPGPAGTARVRAPVVDPERIDTGAGWTALRRDTTGCSPPWSGPGGRRLGRGLTPASGQLACFFAAGFLAGAFLAGAFFAGAFFAGAFLAGASAVFFAGAFVSRRLPRRAGPCPSRNRDDEREPPTTNATPSLLSASCPRTHAARPSGR